MALTVKDIYAKLGLEDPQAWREKAVARNRLHREFFTAPEVRVRRTGRTTQQIVTGLTKVSRGQQVIFAGHNRAMTGFMTETAREFASRLGLDPNLILKPGHVAVIKDHPLP